MLEQTKLKLPEKERKLEPGYAEVRIIQPMDFSFLGLDMKEYGPLGYGKETGLPTKQAKILEKEGYVEIKRIGKADEDG